MFGLGRRKTEYDRVADANGMMRADDRVAYVGRVVYVVMMEDSEKHTVLVAAYMDNNKAAEHTARLQKAKRYAWYRQVDIEG